MADMLEATVNRDEVLVVDPLESCATPQSGSPVGEELKVFENLVELEETNESEEGIKVEASDEEINSAMIVGNTSNFNGTTFTAITLADGTQAYMAQELPVAQGVVAAVGSDTVQVEEGCTLLIQNIPKFLNYQAVLLEDGTPAFLHSASRTVQETYQPVELEDGTTAYISLAGLNSMAFENFSTEGDVETITCDKTEEACIEAAGPSTPFLDDDDDDDDDDEDSNEMCMKEQVKERFMCPHDGCGKFYTTCHHLKVHQRAHTGDRPFRCTESGCNKAFATGYGRKAHVRTHTGEKPYKCPEETCEKSFKTSGDLQKHIRTHTGERPFRCPVSGCGRSFTTSNIRKVHVRTHTGERPYVCPEPECDRAFASATNYKNHLRIHSGEKPYVCTVQGCDKRFTEYSSLYKHHMVHTQQKPYYCSVCTRYYRQASTLAVHKRTAHGILETDDGTEIIFGDAMFTLTNTGNNSKKHKGLNPKMLGFTKVGNRLVALQDDVDNNEDAQEQFLVVTDPAQLVALQHLGVTTSDTIVEELEMTVDDTSNNVGV